MRLKRTASSSEPQNKGLAVHNGISAFSILGEGWRGAPGEYQEQKTDSAKFTRLERSTNQSLEIIERTLMMAGSVFEARH